MSAAAATTFVHAGDGLFGRGECVKIIEFQEQSTCKI